MPCFHSTSAITALRTCAHPLKWTQGIVRPLPKEIFLNLSRFASTTSKHAKTSTLAAESVKSVDIPTILSPAQASFAARKAVVLALRTPVGGVHDAIFIVNSLHHPILKQNPEAAHLPNISKYTGITFNKTINPRLASHALLHGLVRSNQTKHAADLAVAMMDCGMRVHARTLNIVMRALQVGAKKKPFIKPQLPPNFIPNPQRLSDLSQMAQNPSSRLAMEIFTVARRTGQGNMSGIFATLLAICLVNAEIVLASFVFAMTVKEFHHPPPSPEGDTSASTWNKEKYGPRTLVFLPQWGNLVDIMAPMKNYFDHISTLTTTSPEFDPDTLDANLQALAILANLLDLRQLHLPTISSLLTLMYKTPRLDSTVWVLDSDGIPQKVVAYAYFHDVLVRLIESPPGSRGDLKKSTRAHTPPLGLKSCNTLLHYALRHCHSPDLGNQVLVHLTQTRKLVPDQTTYNILLRSGTLLRDNDLASFAMTTLANQDHRQEDKGHSNSKRSKKGEVKEPELEDASRSSYPLQTLANSKSKEARYMASTIKTIHAFEPWAPSRNHFAKLRTALYSLTTHMMYLTSTGQPYHAKTLTFALFPVLSLPLQDRIAQRKNALVRAAYYGPITFTVLLNALVKARSFSEARLLYYLASGAERRSWFTPEPWTLGTEVYTIMLDLCAQECSEAARLERNATCESDRQKVKEMRAGALRMALRLFKRIKKMRYLASNTMRDHGKSKYAHKLVFPLMDERFVTSLIKVLVLRFQYADPAYLPVADVDLKHRGGSAQPHTQRKISFDSYQRTYEQTERDLAERGAIAQGWTEALQFIARGIVQAGIDVPPALRHLFIGRYEAATRPQGRGVSLRVVPWAYPAERPAHAWHPWVVPSLRTRGLVTWKTTRGQRKRMRTYRFKRMSRPVMGEDKGQ